MINIDRYEACGTTDMMSNTKHTHNTNNSDTDNEYY